MCVYQADIRIIRGTEGGKIIRVGEIRGGAIQGVQAGASFRAGEQKRLPKIHIHLKGAKIARDGAPIQQVAGDGGIEHLAGQAQGTGLRVVDEGGGPDGVAADIS